MTEMVEVVMLEGLPIAWQGVLSFLFLYMTSFFSLLLDSCG
jgi:hypothetical protein